VGWSIGYDGSWQRDIGYGVPALCDYPKCNEEIDRGLAYVCSHQEPYGGDGCGLYFCGKHRGIDGQCERCRAGQPPFQAKPDIPRWVGHKLMHPSWAQWREENPDEVAALRGLAPSARETGSANTVPTFPDGESK
jgi:hypothetical protein